MEKGVLIPVDLFNKTFEFLQDQPYRVVGPLIDELRQAVQVVEIPDESPIPTEETSGDE